MTFATRARILTVTAATATLAVTSAAGTASAADTVVQVDVSAVIDGRTVSTVANNVITPWSATDGVDGDGNADGFVTNAVEAILNTMGKTEGGKIGLALPDDGMFAATTRLPAIQLHFSNAAPITSPQTHQLHINNGPQSFMFSVPPATYRKMFLLITTSEGSANLTVTLTYSGGTAAQVITAKLPDYGIGGAAANDPVFFNLIQGMHKWNATDQEGDTPSHTITGIEINPTATGTLTSILVAKTSGHVVFWGATGIATSPVTTGTAGSSGTTDGGAAGATAHGRLRRRRRRGRQRPARAEPPARRGTRAARRRRGRRDDEVRRRGRGHRRHHRHDGRGRQQHDGHGRRDGRRRRARPARRWSPTRRAAGARSGERRRGAARPGAPRCSPLALALRKRRRS